MGKAMRQPRASGLELPRESPCTPSPISHPKCQTFRVLSRCDPRIRPESPRRSRHEPRTCTRERGRYNKEPLSLRSEEHTSELQSHLNLVCRLLLEKKKR